MKGLKYFIFGMCTVIFAIPLLGDLRELLSLWIESLMAKPEKRILEGKKDTVILREFLKENDIITDYVIEEDYYDGDEY